MPKYSAPGVYVEETPSAVMPIAGVGTSTAGFIGVVADPVTLPPSPDPAKPYQPAQPGVPVLVDSWDRFITRFGEIQEGNLVLARAVYGFFSNGGGRCWVVSVKPTAKAAVVDALAGEVTTALGKLATIDEIALVAVPGAVSPEMQQVISEHCSNDKRQDRFAILDAPRVADPTQETKKPPNNDYAAIYFPWIRASYVQASWAKTTENGKEVTTEVRELKTGEFVPPSGHVAGVYARVDTERGVHKAPANELIRGALGVETPVSKESQGALNDAGINVIRDFGGNVTIWGARTYGGDRKPEWKYVTSRRLFIYLRESIERGTQWVVFEPNAPELWARIRRNVSAFLTLTWASGALMGSKPEKAFYVRCDQNTNPAEVRDLGRVVIEVGVALVKPAEFVIFRISQWAGPGK